MLALLGAAGCVTTQPAGARVPIVSPRQPLAEGLFSTFRVLHSADDCRKLDLPGIDCTVNVWNFEGTTLEVDAPPGFEVIAQGMTRDYWFAVRCNDAPATGKAPLVVRVKDAHGSLRYEGRTEIACARATQVELTELWAGDNGRPGFERKVDLSTAPANGIPVPVNATLRTKIQAREASGHELFGWGRTLVSADDAFVLEHEERTPTEPNSVLSDPVLVSRATGSAPVLQVGSAQLRVPVRAVADAEWKLGLRWSTDEHGTHVIAEGKLSDSTLVQGLTDCAVTIYDAQGPQPTQTGDCIQFWLVPNAKKVCVRTRGKEICS
ncbi:MAG: hypothetical protein IRZ16_16680 [Myxococcaceae bacterium]|nr:hypothetical protein [Myxococcaceae bacterium]